MRAYQTPDSLQLAHFRTLARAAKGKLKRSELTKPRGMSAELTDEKPRTANRSWYFGPLPTAFQETLQSSEFAQQHRDQRCLAILVQMLLTGPSIEHCNSL